ncbi:MAG TPA: glycosyl hydrolase family 18 protein [Actinomycetes bacterium]|nr:glycosyl hydrolase family 18 protein [Actinomycetes bacterium]
MRVLGLQTPRVILVAILTMVMALPVAAWVSPPAARSGTAATVTPGLAPLSERRVVTGWIPYWGFPEGIASVIDNSDLVAEVSPFWYRVTSKSQIRAQKDNFNAESVLVAGIAELHAAGIAALPSVTDEGFSAAEMSRLLASRDRRRALVASIAAMVQRTGADGVDVDFESMNFGGTRAQKRTVKRLYPVFLDQLRGKLNAQGAVLSVAVPARKSASDPYWEVFDYDAIGRSVDRARIMTYDYSTSSSKPGPIAPIDWVRQVAKYAATEFRRVPLSVGVPAYGQNWPIKVLSGRCPSGVGANEVASPTSAQALDLIDVYSAKKRWSDSAQEAHFDYERPYAVGGNDCVVLRRVWFGEGRSAQVRLELAQRLGVQGIAVWRLGPEDPSLWKRSLSVAQAIEPAAARSTLTAPRTVETGATFTVVGRFSVAGTPVAAQSVAVQQRVPGRSWRTVAQVVTNSAGKAGYDVSADRTRDWRMRLPGAWDWSTSLTPVKRVKVDTTATTAREVSP